MRSKMIFSFFLGIFLTFTANAYCLYNNSSQYVYAKDTRHNGWNKYWATMHLAPGAHSCCPGNKKECQQAKIAVMNSIVDWQGGYGGMFPECANNPLPVSAHGYIVVSGNDKALFCQASNS